MRWKPSGHWLSLLQVAGVALAVFCVWMGLNLYRGYQQTPAIQMVERLGGQVRYDYDIFEKPEPITPRWFRNIFGEQCFANVAVVFLSQSTLSDDDLEPLERLPQLRQVYCFETPLTERGAAELRAAEPGVVIHGLGQKLPIETDD
jgi:hypothetical protein